MNQNPESFVPKKANIPEHSIAFREAFWVWVKVAIYSFGGPAGQIAVMHRLLVEEKRWISENRFLHALNYCMLLPGPEAQQLATYIGWLMHRTLGGLMSGILFILPGVISILALSILYAGFQDTSFVQALFFGLKPAVMAVVVEAVIRIGRRALKNEIMLGLAALAFTAIFFFEVPFPLIILSAGVVGYVGGRLWIEKFYVIKGHEPKQGSDKSYEADTAIADSAVAAAHTQPSLARVLRVLIVCLLLWFVPLFVLARVFGMTSVYVTEGIFFSKTAVVTFGGAYAVLAYIAQQAVETYGWLKPGEMLDGLGMAETTPGPLIMVVQFVGFMGAYRNPGGLDPMIAGILGSIITTWVTFVPCFLWIFLGAPYIEYLRGNKSLSTALSAITAAVVGVILNLAVWFSFHVVFGQVNEIHISGIRLLVPVWQTVNIASILIAVGAFVAMFRYKLSMIPTLAISAGVGFVYYLIFM
ncbi:MAG TPA: chromate efflux transporter [Thermodesulfobacteriota bacterium]|nr:chromate efflux transporter [Thermodesulfobacteriota bacterium]